MDRIRKPPPSTNFRQLEPFRNIFRTASILPATTRTRLLSLNVPSHHLQRQKKAPPLSPSHSDGPRSHTVLRIEAQQPDGGCHDTPDFLPHPFTRRPDHSCEVDARSGCILCVDRACHSHRGCCRPLPRRGDPNPNRESAAVANELRRKSASISRSLHVPT